MNSVQLLFWACIFNLLSLISLIRATLGGRWIKTGTVGIIWIVFLAITCATAFISLIIFYVRLIKKGHSGWLSELYVNIEIFYRIIFLFIAVIFHLTMYRPIEFSQSNLGLIESLFFAIVSFATGFFVDKKIHDLSKDQKILLSSVISVFFVLLVGALIIEFIEDMTFDEAWNFVNVTALTIGYGNVTVKTTAGKIFLVTFGNVILVFVAYLIIALKNCLVSLSLWIFSLLIIFFFFAGSLVFMFLESWSFVNGVYFTWTTLTTVGYGDLYPTRPITWEFWLLYIYISVCLLAYILGVLSQSIHNMVSFFA